MKMSEVVPGMRLRSTTCLVPGGPDEFVTVTEMTERGFRYSLDAAYSLIPRWGMTMNKEGHEHYGLNGEAFYEVAE